MACSQAWVRAWSSRSSRAATKRPRSCSMLAWFCEVGGTIRAVTMVPSAASSYRWNSTPRGASVAPKPAAPGELGVQGGRVRHLLLDHELRERLYREGQPAIGGRHAGVDRVAARLDQGEQLVVVLEVGELEPGDPLHRGERVVAGPPQR